MMTPEFSTLLADFNRVAPATATAIAECEQGLGVSLPNEYTQFLQWSNGGDGFVGGCAYLVMWPVGQLVALNRSSEVQQFAPGLVLFGSDGGGEAFGFDMRDQQAPVVRTPFIGMSWTCADPMGASFSDFLTRLARSTW